MDENKKVRFKDLSISLKILIAFITTTTILWFGVFVASIILTLVGFE